MFLGIDVGSISTEAVIIDGQGNILAFEITKSGFDHKAAINRVMDGVCRKTGIDKEDIIDIVATGYGRRNVPGTCKIVTEISCHAMGVYKLFPKVRTVIDIGGQDSKVIRISERGFVENFIMNDKCAAGTGRFLEVMANAMDVDVDDLGKYSLAAKKTVRISSTCTVFAESEVISGISEGRKKEDIIAGVHNAIVERLTGMTGSFGMKPDVALTGGVAKNIGIQAALKKRIGSLFIPDEPQITGAYGAALYARSYHKEYRIG